MSSKPALVDRLGVLHLYLLPQRTLTAGVFWLTRRRRPKVLKNLLIRVFIRLFAVNMSEAAHAGADAYPNFNAFFTRPLRRGVRPLACGEHEIACPVDGAVSQAGQLSGDQILQAKGHGYSLVALLGGDATRSNPFLGGSFATLYLSPRDYHRIHMPCAGLLRDMVHVPGKLFSVSPAATRGIPELFARNERLVCVFETKFGPLALVMVGATNVASMEVVWEGIITPPPGIRLRRWQYGEGAGLEAPQLEKGDELGRFNMGSTVIMVVPPHTLEWAPEISPGGAVRMGQLLAVLEPGPDRRPPRAAQGDEASGAAGRERHDLVERPLSR